MKINKLLISLITCLTFQNLILSQTDTVFCSINFDSTIVSCNDVRLLIIQKNIQTQLKTGTDFILIPKSVQMNKKSKLRIEFDEHIFIFRNFPNKNFLNRIDFYFKDHSSEKMLYFYTLTANMPIEKLHKLARDGILYNTLISRVKKSKIR